MKSNSKDRIVVSIIVIVFLVTISGIAYLTFGPHKVKGIYTAGTLIVASNDSEQIKICKKNNAAYAIKGNGVLKYYGLGADISNETTLELATEDFNKLVDGKTYWFDIKLKKADDMSIGVIKKVYTQSIM
ncbi:hypothetical protein [Clostridium sp. FP1]|uniref:hypothetical protein n=1 Tax=Clostridium sp. FP1 TaxID=2724076 RepID=UPI0013E948D1|nr:hypothetical protein [Clostridium sp. FP1]MBZ9632902.1 hypothetical protein [Clostridium sp. FP1]